MDYSCNNGIMKRTDIQKRIIPRNWLFGRLTYIVNNLKAIVNNNKGNFTDTEIKKLKIASDNIAEVINNKIISSEKLKKEILKCQKKKGKK